MRCQLRGGLDEVGTGALAGPFISCIAVFDEDSLALMPPGVKDSKKTTPTQRASLYGPLCQFAVDVGIGHAWPFEIDRIGPYCALQLSYARAVKDLVTPPPILIVDGSHRVDAFKGTQIVEPKADVNYPQVSAASMIAKYFRDEIMLDYELARKRLGLHTYGWSHNCGYGTPDHLEAIKKYGLLIDAKDNTPDHSLYIHRLAYTKKLRGKS